MPRFLGTIMPTQLKQQMAIIGAAQIVGSGVGTLGHAAGVTLVGAVAARRIAPVQLMVRYDHAVAAYTDGGLIVVSYGSTSELAFATMANTLLTNASDYARILGEIDDTSVQGGDSAPRGINQPLTLHSLSPFTNPGSASGVLQITTYYYEVTD